MERCGFVSYCKATEKGRMFCMAWNNHDSESGSKKKEGGGDVSAAELNLHEEARTHHVAARIDQLVTA